MTPVTHFAINYQVRQNYCVEPAKAIDVRELLDEWRKVVPANVEPRSIEVNGGEIDLEIIGRCQICDNWVFDDQDFLLWDDGIHCFCENCREIAPDEGPAPKCANCGQDVDSLEIARTISEETPRVHLCRNCREVATSDTEEDHWENAAQLWIDG